MQYVCCVLRTDIYLVQCSCSMCVVFQEQIDIWYSVHAVCVLCFKNRYIFGTVFMQYVCCVLRTIYYIEQFPDLRTTQRVLLHTFTPGKPVHSNAMSTSLRNIEGKTLCYYNHY